MKFKAIVIVACTLIAGCSGPTMELPVTQSTERATVTFTNGSKVSAIVVRSDADRSLGLGGRSHLGEEEGMLFVFDKPDTYAFWMKNMRFPIDIIWLHDGTVIDVSPAIPAPKEGQTLLPTYQPKAVSSLVLEVNSGWSQANNISIGDSYTVSFSE